MGWTTKHEINFLSKIGTYGKLERDPIKCLIGYIEAAENRDYWGVMDKDVIVRTAKAMLMSMGEKYRGSTAKKKKG